MRASLWFVIGFATTLVVIAVIASIALETVVHGFSANAAPTTIETWTARRARAFAMPREARQQLNPMPNSPEVLKEARAHWADHCAVCHANDGSGNSEMGHNMYPPAPDMRSSPTQRLTDGELFYVIQNGIRLSGMPGWGSGPGHSGEEDSWKLVRFIRHLPNLSSTELQEMERLNPKSPEELEEENQERQFLGGGEPPPAHQQHQHQ
jgi:mono/diheme cytochrome c family protein